MSSIRYKSGKLLLVTLCLALPAACFLWMLLSPEMFLGMRGRRAGLVHFLAGSPLVTGGFVLFFGYLAFRAAATAMSGAAALAITPSALQIRTVFSRHSPAWRDLEGVHVEIDDFGSGGHPVVRVEYRRGDARKNVRLHSALLDADGEEWVWFLARIDEQMARRNEHAASPLRPTAAPGLRPPRIAGFGRKGI